MSEIRKHYFLSEYCIIAEERAGRPFDFSSGAEAKETAALPEKTVESCVFCPGNEEKTPPATAVYRGGMIFSDKGGDRIKGWDLRVFPNLYPALAPGPRKIVDAGWSVQPGSGFHEVIVESPVHGKKLGDLSDRELAVLMEVYRDRVDHYRAKKKITSVSLFKNSGKKAGASLDHSHSQIIALPILPPSLARELQAIQELKACPYCALLEIEKKSDRFIRENNKCIAIAPYYSRFPFEVWILPKEHVNDLAGCNPEVLFSLGEMLRDILLRYRELFGDPAYNYMFYQLLRAPEYHLFIRVFPRVSELAGFEFNTDMYINIVSPETAASYIRGEIAD